MYVLKNALISITRNKGRNILIGAIILVVACACTVTLAINNTASDLISSYESGYAKELTLGFDRQSMMKGFDFGGSQGREGAQEKFSKIASYTVEDVENFADSEHIEGYYYTYTIQLAGNNIEKAQMENVGSSNMGGHGGGMMGGEVPDASGDSFTLTGYSSVQSMTEFIDGTYTMAEIADEAWSVAFDGDYAFINEELAEYNNLGVGDKIKFEDENGKTYTFEVIGIFADNEETEGMPMSPFSNSANTIITNAATLIAITEKNSDIVGQVTPTLIIDDYANVDAIQEEFYAKGLDESYIVQTNEELANAGVSSIANVKTFATTFLVIALIIGGAVLLILNLINIRERKYEIGVLRTIGVSKLMVTAQFVAELMMVALVALVLGAGVGAMVSKSVGNSLLESEIASSNKQEEEIAGNFGGGFRGMQEQGGAKGEMNLVQKPAVQAYDSMNAVVDAVVIVELLVIGIMLVLVGSLAAMISIQRFSPLTILKERS